MEIIIHNYKYTWTLHGSHHNKGLIPGEKRFRSKLKTVLKTQNNFHEVFVKKTAEIRKLY